jgi:two-component system chemotaxis sensor kinase CheA
MDLTAFLQDFRVEAGEHLRALDTQLLKLERNPSDPAPIREMFLSAHTIKGGAAMLGIADVRELAHAVEDVLGHLRDAREPLDAQTADLLFRALDTLRELLDRATLNAGALDGPAAELAAALRQRASRGVEATASPAPEPAAPAEAPRVLLVEDSPTVRLLETMLLSAAGFEVDAVADGTQALVLARTHAYQLVVTAVETRGLRGLELAAALRASPTHRDLPIILMSSDDNPAHRHRAAEVGVQAYIRKGSFGQQRLVETARELVRPGAA